jgi:hypothetical protein
MNEELLASTMRFLDDLVAAGWNPYAPPHTPLETALVGLWWLVDEQVPFSDLPELQEVASELPRSTR